MNTIQLITTVQATPQKVWDCWTSPDHITQWNFASPEWHCPTATNEVQPGGKLSWQMAAKDGSMAFDFNGTYTEVKPGEFLAYTLDDGRKVTVQFSAAGDKTEVVEIFEPDANNVEMQRAGWQAILDNFRDYVEGV